MNQQLTAWLLTLDANAREFFEERAGIRQFDGGLSREEAERLAMQDVIKYQQNIK